MKTKLFLTGIVAVIILSACGDYNKILKSTDYEFKYKKAIDYYEDGEYVRAGTLFQELVNIYRGTSRADEIYYYYAKSMVGQKDYLLATHYFKSLIKEFPGSQYVEEAQFMIGYCSYLLSPNSKLDQTVTREGIESLQLYINLFPYSDRVDEANRLIDELKAKLMHKSYINARLYYDFQNYKAAVISLENSMKEYPETPYREELMYMLMKSKYLLAINSIADKKTERLSDALDEYFSFIDEFPESRYKNEVDRFYKTLSDLLDYNNQLETNIN
ncbi:MAG: outer membrane protein assembly factor BamD [Mariniphaga sp.]|nr:outer membrane protein assembly factor BamD [Mariniphaga sp.]MDD4225709.1 outer membrane protein assembly factor BamD [Mariniphaga sp.]MDD4425217.1 outer membrane protein assembly factor BamD [Mariniphaga sp.]